MNEQGSIDFLTKYPMEDIESTKRYVDKFGPASLGDHALAFKRARIAAFERYQELINDLVVFGQCVMKDGDRVAPEEWSKAFRGETP